MNTYDTKKLAARHLDIDKIHLPTGMGVGALRHRLSTATRTHWQEITQEGTYETVEKHAQDFLGDATEGNDMTQANPHWEFTDDVAERIQAYLAHSIEGGPDVSPATLFSTVESIGTILVSYLCDLVADHIRDDVEEQTGHDPDSSVGAEALQLWGVK